VTGISAVKEVKYIFCIFLFFSLCYFASKAVRIFNNSATVPSHPPPPLGRNPVV
jgi:hypothetical protein